MIDSSGEVAEYLNRSLEDLIINSIATSPGITLETDLRIYRGEVMVNEKYAPYCLLQDLTLFKTKYFLVNPIFADEVQEEIRRNDKK